MGVPPGGIVKLSGGRKQSPDEFTISLGAGPGDIDILIEEGFATAFKILGTPDIDFPGFTEEAGYGVPGSPDATQGTRIALGNRRD